MVLTIYSRPGCHLCQDMKETAEQVVRGLGIAARIDEISIAGEPELEARYGAEIPVSEEALTRILTAGRTERAGRAG
jgi:glutaredoxin